MVCVCVCVFDDCLRLKPDANKIHRVVIYSMLEVREPLCSVFRPSVITHFKSIVLTCCACLQRIAMRPHGWWVIFPQPHDIAHTTLNSDKLCTAPQSETLFQPLINFILPKSVLFYYKRTFQTVSCFLKVFNIFVSHFLRFWNQLQLSCWQRISTFVTVSLFPI